MRAVVFHAIGDIRLDDVAEPKIKQRTDVIVRLTASAICGTDLHIVRGTLPGMVPGTILGHEGVGIVEEVGGEGLGDVRITGQQQAPAAIEFGRRRRIAEFHGDARLVLVPGREATHGGRVVDGTSAFEDGVGRGDGKRQQHGGRDEITLMFHGGTLI